MLPRAAAMVTLPRRLQIPFQELNNTFFMCACLQIEERREEHADPAVRHITGWIDGDKLAGELHGFQSAHVGPTSIATRVYDFYGLGRGEPGLK
jgi:hypothetical protein